MQISPKSNDTIIIPDLSDIAIDISKPFDFFGTKCYALHEVSTMDLREENADVKKIDLCCFVDKNNGERVLHKNRRSYGLAYHIDGERRYTFEDHGILFTKPGSLIFLPKNSTYLMESIEPGTCFAINFELMEDVDFLPFSISIRNGTEILENFKKANAVWQSKKAGYEMKCRSYLYNIIYLIQNEHNSYANAKQRAIIAPALEYIEKNYHLQTGITVRDLSECCGVSETYLRRLFRSCLGVSPVQYVNRMRLTRAGELLSSGFYTVSEVMTMSGYNDDAYFSRNFKKRFGVPPREYGAGNK